MVIGEGEFAAREGIMSSLWVRIDAGKRKHHFVVLDTEAKALLSKAVANDEADLLEIIGTVLMLAGDAGVRWAIDLNAGGAALLMGRSRPGTRLRAWAGYPPCRRHLSRDGKTDAKDARIIADQARIRTDLQPVRDPDRVSVDLRLLTAKRLDVIHDRVRSINRLRATLLEYFPALEAAFDYRMHKAARTLLTRWATPQALRRAGGARLTRWLQARKCRASASVAELAVSAAEAQHTELATQAVGAKLVGELAQQVLDLDNVIASVDAAIAERLRDHPYGELLMSVPGFGVILSATFIARTGGDLTAFDSANQLAGAAGLAPVPRDSGRISGNLHRPRRFDRILLRTCYLSAHSSLKNSPATRPTTTPNAAKGNHTSMR